MDDSFAYGGETEIQIGEACMRLLSDGSAAREWLGAQTMPTALPQTRARAEMGRRFGPALLKSKFRLPLAC